ncbi:MAG: ABC transporter permease [Phycisphaeraceae bacterium]|nr:ABC transporter permease [Phycisphaeraceae bacterium]
MYPLLLVRRYLTSRVIPFIAVAAVALCVALVITVVSVMSGFLEMVRTSGRSLWGDVIISRPLQGIPDYESLIAAILEQPEAAAAAPIVETYGVLRMPYPAHEEKSVNPVQVWAIDPESFGQVTGFDRTIYWKPPATAAEVDAMLPDDPRRILPPDILDRTRRMEGVNGRPGAILGIHVSIGNTRESDGSYRFIGGWWMPNHEVTLTVAPISGRGRVGEMRDLVMPVVNEFASGVFQVDKQRVMIPLVEGQRLLRMNEQPIYDRTAPPAEDGSLPLIGTAPARATHIFVRGESGTDSKRLRDAVERAYISVWESQRDRPPLERHLPARSEITINTWEQQLADIIGPVEKEREMMRILFSIIYLVCAGLVLSIFWAIVAEKTRDIGILRAVGAGRSGILAIFLQYGVAIGVVGSAAGVGLAYLFVTNINRVHAAIGEPAPWWLVVLVALAAATCVAAAIWSLSRDTILWVLLWTVGALALTALALALHYHKGWVMWDPRVYYFSRIPSQVDWVTAGITVVGAVVFSVLGASVPAARAADIDPVRALRYE